MAQIDVNVITRALNEDFKTLLDKKKAYESYPDVAAYLGVDESIKAARGQISADMLDLYRRYGIQSIKGDVATVYIKDDYDILRDRLTAAQIIAMFDYNPDAFKLTDKVLRDTIDIAKKAMANGDVSEGVQALLSIDLDRLRGPVKHSAIVRVGKY